MKASSYFNSFMGVSDDADGQSEPGAGGHRLAEALDWFSDSVTYDALLCECAYVVC
jgi:hypothetical protein